MWEFSELFLHFSLNVKLFENKRFTRNDKYVRHFQMRLEVACPHSTPNFSYHKALIMRIQRFNYLLPIS